ncbi:hypothetical protein SAMN04488540_102414 [Ferrimonas sediminum]|uniref:DUF2065 domain-containing protein n=1 Tax=Ferrimonas sediminum TaxID=718193 RepID=A0A1G8ML83_9GAMM|nr:DUF2065 domain-containing protein [Ferrimonas sediminum]SDI68606.1 hypothetical protein SAMN04488540_102414 [Ferrimonas sediminum]
MSIQTWLIALGMVLVLEGIGPMMLPKQWRSMVTEMSRQPDHLLRRLGGVLVTIGGVILYIFSR